MKTGLLIIGHGTRDQQGADEFRELGQLVKSRLSQIPVAACFLELADPPIDSGIRELLAQGVQRILIAPLLLFAAGHAKRDVPEAVALALVGHPQIELSWLPAFGSHPTILRLSQQRLEQAVLLNPTDSEQQINQRSIEDRLLLVIGRGSSDSQATAALREFTARRATQAGVAVASSCFVAVQTPNLHQGLAWAAAAPQSQVLIQPHLLFSGLLLREIEAAVHAQIPQRPDKAWYLSPRLGAAPELAQVIVEFVETELLTNDIV